jgi:hypothetical protein
LPLDTLSQLQKIAEVCASCQETAVPQQRFKVAFPHDGRFAEEIALDLQHIDGVPFLQVVDLTTGFGAAQWLQGAMVEAVWETFLECWATVYIGYPNTTRTDAGSIFVSPKWKRFTDLSKIKLVQSGVEAHNSLGIGERKHDPLRRVYHKVRKDFPRMSLELALRLAVKAMNDTMGPNGLVPSLLVFGMIPRFPIIDANVPDQEQRGLAMQVSREEYQNVVAEMRVKAALLHNVPAAADMQYKEGDLVLAKYENRDTWDGTFEVVAVDDKILTVRDPNNPKRWKSTGYQQRLNKQQVRPYVNDEGEKPTHLVDPVLSPLSNDAILSTHLTEILSPTDPRKNDQKVIDAKQKEIAELVERGT